MRCNDLVVKGCLRVQRTDFGKVSLPNLRFLLAEMEALGEVSALPVRKAIV